MERFSKKRQAILDCLRGTTIHPTAEWVYGQLRHDYPSLSLGTVYRNLYQLKEAGQILSMGVVAGQEHFDGNTAPHAHAVCIRCGRIHDLPLTDAFHDVMAQAHQATGYRVELSYLAGTCPDCLKQFDPEEKEETE